VCQGRKLDVEGAAVKRLRAICKWVDDDLERLVCILFVCFFIVIIPWMFIDKRIETARRARCNDLCTRMCYPNAVIVCKEVNDHNASYDGLHAVCSKKDGNTVAKKAPLEELNAYSEEDYR
jgi:hypothetical protein